MTAPNPLFIETVGHRWGETTQALGICFTDECRVVLVTWNGEDWSLPGGSREPGETLEQTLAREVREDSRLSTEDRGALSLR